MKRSVLRLASLVLGAVLCGVAPVAQSDVVEARLPSGKIVTADFRRGARDRPAVLVLHGFLQTRSFPTVASVAEAFATAGYTVVAPTLSLGISRRNKSLPCEAIHLHALKDDVAEVAFWVRWLAQKGHDSVVLVGHSFGNIQLLDYLGQTPSPAVKRVLMISLTDVEVKQNAQQRAQLAQVLRERVARRDRSLAEVEVGHCKKYVGPPDAVLSYLAPTRETMLAAVAKSPARITVILGDKDDRMGGDWIDKLRARNLDVRVIPGASHFFDNQYEFDLQEAVLQATRER